MNKIDRKWRGNGIMDGNVKACLYMGGKIHATYNHSYYYYYYYYYYFG